MAFLLWNGVGTQQASLLGPIFLVADGGLRMACEIFIWFGMGSPHLAFLALTTFTGPE